MHRFASLKFRLVAGSLLLLLILFGVFSFYAVWFHERQLMDQVRGSADRISEFLKSSTHYSMLVNRKDDVYRLMRTIGQQPGMESIRIYNKRGDIVFSTDTTEQGARTDLRAEACVACHTADQPLTSLPPGERIRIYDGPNGRILGLINPIRNEPACSGDACHPSVREKTVLGVLDVRMSLTMVDAGMANARAAMGLVAVALVLVVSGVVWWFLDRTVLTPVDRLMEGTQEVAAGRLDHHVLVATRDELGELAKSFNAMTESIRSAREENRRWGETLEERIREKTEELTAVHRRIVHVEKMASLGRLSATVAHELNNPLAGILTYAKLLRRRIESERERLTSVEDLLEDTDIIVRETNRCGDIVKNLLLFSKKESGEFTAEPLSEMVRHAYQLLRHHLEIREIRFVEEIDPNAPELFCDSQQIEQALIAMFVNAADAMPDGGTLTVRVMHDPAAGTVTLAVKDTGIGISPEHLPRIFEPFFTTKEGGQGVGLGLSVVYGIVERHGGTAAVESRPGAGTTFVLTFPTADRRTRDVTTQGRAAGIPS